MISSAKTIKFSGQPLPHFYTVIFFSPRSNRVLRVFTSALQVSKCTQFVHKDIASLLVWLFHKTALIQAHVLKWQPYFPSPSKYVSTKIVQKTQASTIGPSLIGPLGNSLRKTSQGKFTCAVTWNFHSLEGHDFNLKFFLFWLFCPLISFRQRF